jgi:hypothetical protein
MSVPDRKDADNIDAHPEPQVAKDGGHAGEVTHPRSAERAGSPPVRLTLKALRGVVPALPGIETTDFEDQIEEAMEEKAAGSLARWVNREPFRLHPRRPVQNSPASSRILRTAGLPR